MSFIKGTGVGGFGEYNVRGGPQLPAVCLLGTAEVTPTRVGICAADYPQHWGRLQPSGTGSEGSFHSVPLPVPHRGNTGEGVNPPASETGGSCHPIPNKNGPRELDSVMCNHRTSPRSAQGTVGIPNGWSLRLPTRGKSGGVEAERPAVWWGPGGDPSGRGGAVQYAHQLQKAKKTGAWMTVQPPTVNGTELGAQ